MAYDRDDLLFQLFDVAGLGRALDQGQYDDLDRTMVEGLLDTADRIAAAHFEPHGALLDENEPVYKDGQVVMASEVKTAVDALIDAGFLGATFAEEYGGMNLPNTIGQAVRFIFNTANVSFAGYPMLTAGAANLIATFGSEKQKQRYLLPMVEGRFFGTMCLSEPHAGSSLADIKTKAVPRDDGRYTITGRKMWISGGDHELSETIVHLVLAKIPGGPSGVKGISLFIVPKHRLGEDGLPAERNDVALAGLNHKMGFRGITNCALNFGEQGDCIGELVGEPHQGLGYMFQMMNEARIEVGMGAAALGQAGFQASLDYARERPQGRAITNKDPDSPMIPIIEHTDVRRLLLAQKAAVEPALALGLYCASLVDTARFSDDTAKKEEAHLLLDMLTPVAKSWPSEFCLEANKHAIQVLGGAGYTRDYPVERLYRDNRLNPIHEGTHGIQGLDILGRKMVMKGGAGAQLLLTTLMTDIQSAEGEEALAPFANDLKQAVGRLQEVTMALAGGLAQNPEEGLANATLFLDFVGHIIMGWMWLRIVRASHDQDPDGQSAFHNGKRQAALYFYNRELVRTKGWADTLNAKDRSALDMKPDWF